ncbi:hypothetical protein ETB97_011842 [Aspergillus alliaceus]|uniref:Uncharacterized protein n=1 Tax=Petromyces alliaceus TaxID=209559 RepID=A0A8H6AAJ0_PETAA|nr:hypothetical protein ETB97_011842 [Aspergillus burnettii]
MDSLDEDVSPGDLILVHNDKYAHMLVVQSVAANNDTSRSTSSIIIKEVNWNIPDEQGFWALSGPHVYFVKEEETAHRGNFWCRTDDSFNIAQKGEHSLYAFLQCFTNADQTVHVLVNPHGSLRLTERLEHRVAFEKSLSKERRDELKNEILREIRTRFRLINERRDEMGLPLEDVENIVKQCLEYMSEE